MREKFREIINLENGLKISLYLFVLCLFVSKAGLNIFGVVFSLFTFILMSKTKYRKTITLFCKENNAMLNFTFLFFLGVLVNLISDGRMFSLGKYVSRHIYFLMIPGLLVFLKKYKHKVNFLALISLLIGILYSFWVFFRDFHGNYEPLARINSFYPVGSWGAVLLFALVFLLPVIFDSESCVNKIQRIGLITLFVLGVVSLLLMNGRAVWLTLALTMAFYIIFFARKFLVKISVFFLLTIFTLWFVKPQTMNQVKYRILSIGNVEDVSNKGRILMWKEGLLFAYDNMDKKEFYFGTGLGSMKIPFEKYLNEKGVLEKLQLETSNQFSTVDNHNSFLNILNQLGIVYFVFYIYFLFNLLMFYVKKLKSNNIYIKSGFLLLISFILCGIFYSYSTSFEMNILFFLLALSYVSIEEKKRI